MKEVIIISDYSNSLKRRLQGSRNSSTIIPLNYNVVKLLKNYDIDFKDYNQYYKGVNHDKIAKELFKFLFEWPDRKIFKGKSFKKLLAYKGISFWWVIRKPFFYWCFNSVKYFEFFKEIIRKENPRSIRLISSNEQLTGILKIACRKNNIKLAIDCSKKSVLAKSLTFANLYTVTFLRVLHGMLRYRRFTNSGRNKLLFLTNSFYWQLTRDIKTGMPIKDDVHFGNILRKARESNEVLIVDLPKMTSTAWTSFIEKKYPHTPWEYFLFLGLTDPNIKKKVNELRKFLDSKWEIFIRSKEVRGSMKFRGLDLLEIHRNDFYNYFHKSLSSFISFYRNVEIARKIIKECNIKTCLLTDEMGSGWHFVCASKMEGIKSFGLQHGNFGDIAPSYRYGKNEICYGEFDDEKCIVPDKTIVYGNFFMRKLIRNSYSESSIKVCGFPRSDVAFNKKILYKKSEFYKRFNINPGHKIIFLATSGHYNMKEIIPMATQIYKITGEVKDKGIALVHKPHSGGSEDIKFYEELNRKFNANAKILTGNVDLYEVMNASDVVISSITSTIVTEAIMLDKPVITVTISGKLDSLKYKKLGIVIDVERESDLKPVILEVLANPGKMLRGISHKRKKFIRDTLNKIDGKISDRILRIITNI